MADESDAQAAPETVPLEVHVVALRAELERARRIQQVATAALLSVALLLLWQAIRDGRATP